MSLQDTLRHTIDCFTHNLALDSSLYQQLIELTIEAQQKHRLFPLDIMHNSILKTVPSESKSDAENNLVSQGDIEGKQVDVQVQYQLDFLATHYIQFEQFCRTKLFLAGDLAINLWCFWLPFALNLVRRHHKIQRPLVQGILGVQGTGKTTLSQILIWILEKLGYRAINLSLDDLYKTYAERVELQKQDPRLIWRGPPGTHDIDLGITTLDTLRSAPYNRPIPIPRFDKSAHNGAGDRTSPEVVNGINIVLFEGWFVGVVPVNPKVFDDAPYPIRTSEHRSFAKICNDRLRQYIPLWERLDTLAVLYPTRYQLSKDWRLQAEHQMIAQGKTGLTDSQIEVFVEYFWCALHPELFIQPLVQRADGADMVIEIAADHTPSKINQPKINQPKLLDRDQPSH